jgi:type VI secretion system protein ImpM
VPGAPVNGPSQPPLGGLEALLDSLAAEAPSNAPGWFGKLSMLGDFAHRRLPSDFITVCDDWLSSGMAASRLQMEESRWLDAYLTGPLWRFAWAPGVAGDPWWFGLMMPSVDKVGRYFPLVVARAAPQAPQSLAGINALEDWFEQVGVAVLATLQPGATLDAFDAALGRLPPWEVPPAHPVRRPHMALLAGRERCTLDGPAGLAQWLVGCGSLEALQRCAGHSLWWPDHAASSDNSLSIAPGLPDPEHFSLLLQGVW